MAAVFVVLAVDKDSSAAALASCLTAAPEADSLPLAAEKADSRRGIHRSVDAVQMAAGSFQLDMEALDILETAEVAAFQDIEMALVEIDSFHKSAGLNKGTSFSLLSISKHIDLMLYYDGKQKVCLKSS